MILSILLAKLFSEKGGILSTACHAQAPRRGLLWLGEQAERAGHADDFAARYAASELRATNDAMLESDMAERQVSTHMCLACFSCTFKI